MTPEELRRRRDRLGLTQAQLAARLDATPNTVARWERGELTMAKGAMIALALDAVEREREEQPHA